MALASFFDRVAASAGGNLSISRESLEERLRDVTPTIITTTGSGEGSRWTAELLVNLLARIYPRLSLMGPPSLSDLARSINPEIELDDRPGRPEFTIATGHLRSPGGLVAGASGWVAEVNLEGTGVPDGPANPYGSGAAACLAAGELFRRVFGLPGMQRSVRLSLLDFGESAGQEDPLPQLKLEDTVLVGLGAVGHGLLWALHRHQDRSGIVHLVDDERIELSNLQRYVCAFYEDVNRPKTVIGTRELKTGAFECIEHPETFAQYAARLAAQVPRTVCVSVDNIDGRRAVQAMLPRLTLNAYTGVGSLGVSWHEMDSGLACLACLYQPKGAAPSHADLIAAAFGLPVQRAALLLAEEGAMTKPELEQAARKLGLDARAAKQWAGKPLRSLYQEVICGGAEIPVASRGRSEVVPLAHQSALAGILLAAELVKRTVPELRARSQATTLVAWHDVRRPPPRSWLEPRAPTPGCICQDSIYAEVYRKKWGLSLVDRG